MTRFKVGCERDVTTWLVCYIWRWTLEVRYAGVVCHTIQSRVWERDVADWLVWRWRWSGRGVWLAVDEDGLTWFRYRSMSKSVNCEGWESGLEARRRTAGVWTLGLRIRTCFFFIYSTPLTEPVQFGWGFSGFRFLKPKPNQKFFQKF
jgi:hypothetical protein